MNLSISSRSHESYPPPKTPTSKSEIPKSQITSTQKSTETQKLDGKKGGAPSSVYKPPTSGTPQHTVQQQGQDIQHHFDSSNPIQTQMQSQMLQQMQPQFMVSMQTQTRLMNLSTRVMTMMNGLQNMNQTPFTANLTQQLLQLGSMQFGMFNSGNYSGDQFDFVVNMTAQLETQFQQLQPPMNSMQHPQGMVQNGGPQPPLSQGHGQNDDIDINTGVQRGDQSIDLFADDSVDEFDDMYAPKQNEPLNDPSSEVLNPLSHEPLSDPSNEPLTEVVDDSIQESGDESSELEQKPKLEFESQKLETARENVIQSLGDELDKNLKSKVNKYVNVYGSKNYRIQHDPSGKSIDQRAVAYAKLQNQIKAQTKNAILAIKDSYLKDVTPDQGDRPLDDVAGKQFDATKAGLKKQANIYFQASKKGLRKAARQRALKLINEKMVPQLTGQRISLQEIKTNSRYAELRPIFDSVLAGVDQGFDEAFGDSGLTPISKIALKQQRAQLKSKGDVFIHNEKTEVTLKDHVKTLESKSLENAQNRIRRDDERLASKSLQRFLQRGKNFLADPKFAQLMNSKFADKNLQETQLDSLSMELFKGPQGRALLGTVRAALDPAVKDLSEQEVVVQIQRALNPEQLLDGIQLADAEMIFESLAEQSSPELSQKRLEKVLGGAVRGVVNDSSQSIDSLCDSDNISENAQNIVAQILPDPNQPFQLTEGQSKLLNLLLLNPAPLSGVYQNPEKFKVDQMIKKIIMAELPPEMKTVNSDFDLPSEMLTNQVIDLLRGRATAIAAQTHPIPDLNSQSKPTEITVGDKTYSYAKTYGSGAFGAAHSMISPDGSEVVVKTFKDVPVAAMQREIRAMLYAAWPEAHENVLKMLDFRVDQNNNFMVVMEAAAGGDLDGINKKMHRLIQMGAFETETLDLVSRAVMAQALAGTGDMHEKTLIHMDQKLTNMLINYDGKVKIGDLGLSQVGHETDFFGGTYQYMSPDVLDPNKTANLSSDIHSLGIIQREFTTLNSQLIGDTQLEINKERTILEARIKDLKTERDDLESQMRSAIQERKQRIEATEQEYDDAFDAINQGTAPELQSILGDHDYFSAPSDVRQAFDQKVSQMMNEIETTKQQQLQQHDQDFESTKQTIVTARDQNKVELDTLSERQKTRVKDSKLAFGKETKMYDKDKQLKEKRLQKGPLKKDEQSQTLTITREHEIKSLGAYEKTVNPMLSPEQGVDIETLLETDYYNDPVLVSDPMQEMLAFLAQTDLIVSTDPTTQKKSYSLSETDSEKLKQIQGQLKSFALRGG